MLSHKSQSSIEFFVLNALAFFVAIIFVAAVANEMKGLRDNKEFFLIKDLALKLQKEVAIASSVENGYKRSFTLPEELESIVDYSITTTNSTITINSSNSAVSVRIPTVVGNFTKSTNTIEKLGDQIYINRQ